MLRAGPPWSQHVQASRADWTRGYRDRAAVVAEGCSSGTTGSQPARSTVSSDAGVIVSTLLPDRRTRVV